MAKAVFRPGEAKNIEEKVMLPLYKDYSPIEDVEVEEEEVYTGPTAEDLRREAEEYKLQFEQEKLQLKADAQKEAERIIKAAEDTAFAEVKRQTDQAAVIKADAENEAASIIEKAKAEAAQIVAEAQAQHDKLVADARSEGFEQGSSEGYEKGKAEVERLIERMHKVLEAVMQRREEILQDTESQIVELVILMARKVIKILSENQKNVIMANTVAALRKVKTRGNVTLRVNIEDVKLTTAHADEFIQHVENVQGITVQEDSAVEKGGCIVETDFGAIDARISSQLTELENKILEVSPVKNIKRQDPLTSAE
ncbi:flagellar assembly protein FliH [Treponema bryantii]|uniref:Flagellar assembly protein FliH n=1 Tax=Treponema bryantii TaxID=163 RepID=A0A1H9A4T4_9SPIR|nr:flagellar assembly protein FliH [Treponema bryantii]BDC93802.1 flagellar assembly protein FliH [Treponema bryantii]SEP71732.1 flagellar assembly protein FliH [Treponema bryantii]